jgi:hypothetical protein
MLLKKTNKLERQRLSFSKSTASLGTATKRATGKETTNDSKNYTRNDDYDADLQKAIANLLKNQ